MDHLEMVEKLREKANVSYEEATQALEACDWDLLDALLMLESKGRLQEMESEAYSTRQDADTRNENSTGEAFCRAGGFRQSDLPCDDADPSCGIEGCRRLYGR